MIVRITGSGFVKTGAVADGHPVEFRHWKDVVDEADSFLESAAVSEEEEAVVELWLEDPMSFQDQEDSPTRMMRTGGMIRHADGFGRKQAVVRETNWDAEFADAQAHVASVLKNLGNGR
jgi:hypothetical protein